MKKIRWGVVGTATIARNCTIPGMQLAENCELYAIAGRNKEKTDAYKEEFGFQKAYYDYEELLKDPEVEAVYLPLPNHLHAEWIRKALNAGKHVLCEKPITPTADEMDVLYETAEKNHVFLMEAFAYLHTPFMKALKEEVDSGAIGKLTYIDTAFLTSEHDLSNIRMHKESAGGSIYDLGCYCTSLALWLTGREPESIKGFAEFSKEGIDLFSSVLMKYDDGLRVSFDAGMNLEFEEDRRYDRLYLHGTRGFIRSDYQYNQPGDVTYTICTDGVVTEKTVPMRQNYCLEVEQLGRCIEGLETPHITQAFSHANARTLDRIFEVIGY